MMRINPDFAIQRYLDSLLTPSLNLISNGAICDGGHQGLRVRLLLYRYAGGARRRNCRYSRVSPSVLARRRFSRDIDAWIERFVAGMGGAK